MLKYQGTRIVGQIVIYIYQNQINAWKKCSHVEHVCSNLIKIYNVFCLIELIVWGAIIWKVIVRGYFSGEQLSRRQLSGWQFCRRQLSEEQYSWGQFSWGAIFRGVIVLEPYKIHKSEIWLDNNQNKRGFPVVPMILTGIRWMLQTVTDLHFWINIYFHKGSTSFWTYVKFWPFFMKCMYLRNHN